MSSALRQTPARHIYHLAVREEWLDALRSETSYRRSTLGKSLEEVGFVHCSFADQLRAVADNVFGGRDDVVLLTIDPSKVRAETRVESLDGGDEGFPHIYGALPLEAVVACREVPLVGDGHLAIEEVLDGRSSPETPRP